MTQNLHKGDKVRWKSPVGSTEGTVEKKLTADRKIQGHQVKASADDPQYLVKSAKTGKPAAHKPGALHKKK